MAHSPILAPLSQGVPTAMAKKKPKRDRSDSFFVTFSDPAKAKKLREICEREMRTPSRQIELWLGPHLT